MVRVTPLKPKKCKECKNTFVPNKPIQTYCGYECSNIAGNRRKKKEVLLTCLVCKTRFTKRPSDIKNYTTSANRNRYRYCSRQCWSAKTQTVSSLKKKVWSLFALYIKERDNWTCYTCGKYDKGSTMHAGHFISRRHNATLFDEDNVHAQCAGCNMFNNGQPHIYAERIINERGQEFLLALIAKSKETKKFTKPELLAMCETYKNKLLEF